ncbi:MAG: glycosyltransferase family 2 protein [Candidatus Sulfotelmatobacter sp.]
MKISSKALIITVNFKSAECTVRFLSSASRLDGFSGCDWIVVDNGSQDGSIERIGEAVSGHTNIELLASPENLGYFGAATWALRHYRSLHLDDAPNWVIVCNNDIVFEDAGFLRRLLDRDPDAVGMIAPSILSALTGHDANPSIAQRPSRFRMMRYRMWLSNYYAMWFKQWLSPLVRKGLRKRSGTSVTPGGNAAREIYAPHGAFMIFSRKFFEAGCYIDEGFFLYAEEFSVAEMCRKVGLPIVHDPELKVCHQEGQSSGRMLTRKIHRYQKEGFEYALARHEDGYPELGDVLREKESAQTDACPDLVSLSGDISGDGTR